MAETWFSCSPLNWLFLNLNFCTQGCSMPNFTFLGLPCVLLFEKWPKLGSWPKQGSHMVLNIGSFWILINIIRDVPCQISNCWVYPWTSFPRCGHVLSVLIWGFGGYWKFLTGVLHLALDLDMVTGLWFAHVPNFGSLCWICRCKEHPCSLSLDLGLRRTLEVPDWGIASWSWFRYGYLS